MADPLDLTDLVGLSQDDFCTIEASCVTGFEPIAAEEVKELLCIDQVNICRGRVLFDISVTRVEEVLGLRCVNHVWVLIGHTARHSYPEESKEEQLDSLVEYVEQKLDWEKGLHVWRQITKFSGDLYPESLVSNIECSKDNQITHDGATEVKIPRLSSESVIKFRCTCYRSGCGHHKFKSTEVQAHVGGKVQDKFHWPVDCKNYNLEFVINCDLDQVYCGISLTTKSLGDRTISAFGPCTLRPTIAACLVRLANIQPGEIVLDPMCGGGSIPLEGSLNFPHAYYLGSEIHSQAVTRCRQNLDMVVDKEGLDSCPAMDVVQWDSLNPPVRDNCVDVLISDLPFGKRSGSKADNRVLYPDTLLSMARLVRPDTGRAVLLTQDKTSLFKSFGKVSRFWRLGKHFTCNIGGLTAMVFQLSRTSHSPP